MRGEVGVRERSGKVRIMERFREVAVRGKVGFFFGGVGWGEVRERGWREVGVRERVWGQGDSWRDVEVRERSRGQG